MADEDKETFPLPSYAVIDDTDGSATITLKYGFEISGVKTKTIKLRRPKVIDRMVVSRQHKAKGSDEQELILYANLSDLLPADIESLDLQDYGRVTAVFRHFLSSEE